MLFSSDWLASSPGERLPLEALRDTFIGSLCAIWAPGSPVQAETPFAIVLATSFDQRSPHRLSVTLALSA